MPVSWHPSIFRHLNFQLCLRESDIVPFYVEDEATGTPDNITDDDIGSTDDVNISNESQAIDYYFTTECVYYDDYYNYWSSYRYEPNELYQSQLSSDYSITKRDTDGSGPGDDDNDNDSDSDGDGDDYNILLFGLFGECAKLFKLDEGE